jgi:hypothetical protein
MMPGEIGGIMHYNSHHHGESPLSFVVIFFVGLLSALKGK